jgi:phage-related protein
MWDVEFYKNQDGECPTQEFLDELSPSIDLPFVMNDLGRLEEFGNQLRRPQADYLERDIYELRTETASGQIRLLYFFFYHNTFANIFRGHVYQRIWRSRYDRNSTFGTFPMASQDWRRYCYQEKIIISHGIRKKQKVPKGQIDRAVANRKDYFDRHERKVDPINQGKQNSGQKQVRRKRK